MRSPSGRRAVAPTRNPPNESFSTLVTLVPLSSIFVACPLLMWLGVSKQDLMPKARDEAALARRP